MKIVIKTNDNLFSYAYLNILNDRNNSLIFGNTYDVNAILDDYQDDHYHYDPHLGFIHGTRALPSGARVSYFGDKIIIKQPNGEKIKIEEPQKELNEDLIRCGYMPISPCSKTYSTHDAESVNHGLTIWNFTLPSEKILNLFFKQLTEKKKKDHLFDIRAHDEKILGIQLRILPPNGREEFLESELYEILDDFSLAKGRTLVRVLLVCQVMTLDEYISKSKI